jgi:uncharacterized damage-inducible protein DinB
MNMCEYATLMSRYNEWMNAKVYEAAGRLTVREFQADKGAFFKSVCGTLNHILVADIIWLKRFAQHPAAHPALEPVRKLTKPKALDQVLSTRLAALSDQRKLLDIAIKQWAESLSVADLDHLLHYTSTEGVAYHRPMASLLMHFFNHQTHHRGQVTTLLTQMGQDVGVTDLVMLIPEHKTD